MANAGDPMALLCSGLMRYFGWGVEQNRAKGLERFFRVAPQPAWASEALYILGMAHYYGYGLVEDEAEAARYLDKASRHGHAEATYMLGVMYHYGYGVERDIQRAVSFLKKAASMGSVRAGEEINLTTCAT